MAFWGASGLSAHEDTVVRVASLTGSFQLLLKGTQPLGHQVNVLQEIKTEFNIKFSNLVFLSFCMKVLIQKTSETAEASFTVNQDDTANWT